MKRVLIVVLALACAPIAIALSVGQAGPGFWRAEAATVPTSRVTRGDVDTTVFTSGELRASRIQTLSAPGAGEQLRLLTLKPTGAVVKAGDVVMTFDPSVQEENLAVERALLMEAELEIQALEAEIASLYAQDSVELLTARFDVRSAELDVQGNELLSAIQAKENDLTLAQARRRLAQFEGDVGSKKSIEKSAMTVLLEKREKAKLAIAQAERLVERMTVRAPDDGIVSVVANRDGVTYSFQGVTYPEYREGDTVPGGRPVAELLDVRTMELIARVSESARANIAVGQRATLTLDGWGGTTLTARVNNLGVIRGATGLASLSDTPARFADVSLTLDAMAPEARAGVTAMAKIVGESLRNVLYVPRHAVLSEDGRTVVYARSGAGTSFIKRPVTVVAVTDSVAVVSDLGEGLEVALADPTGRLQ
jgi:HlyD family secretion protein